MVSSVQVAVKVPFHNAIASKDGTIVVFASTKNAYVLRVETGTVAALESKGHIRAMAYSETRRILACVTDSKELALFDVDSGTLVNTRQVWKRPNCVAFTQDSQKIVIGDKFGDVYSYHIDNVDIAATLLLGHVSIVTDFAWTNDFKQLITADRDEKLRVNRYPETFILDQFLLGHLEFVSRIVVVAGNDNVAISGGGDPFLMVWDCKTGQPKQKFDFVQALGGLPEGVQPCVTNLRYDQKNELVAVTLEKCKKLVVLQYKESGLALSQIVEMPSIVLGTELSGNSLWVLCMEAPLINLFTKSVDGQFVAGTVHTALLEVEPTAGAMPGYCETGLLRKWSNWQPDALDHHNKVPAEYPEMKLRKKQKRGGKQRRNSRAAQQSGNA